jgi:hypothetical protein
VTLDVEDDRGATARDTEMVTVRPPANYDGNWLLNPQQASQQCMNFRRNYMVPFPAAMIALQGSTTATVSANVAATMRMMTGAIDRTMNPPRLSLSWTGTETEATCGTAQVMHRVNAELRSDRAMGAGRFSVLYMWTDAVCNCAKTFDFSGAKR